MNLRASMGVFMGVFTACVPLPQSSSFSQENPKEIQLSDRVYEPGIRTAMLHPDTGSPQANLEPAVTEISRMNLLLEFDDLSEQSSSYSIRLIHCNRDWSKSALQDLDFLIQFNSFPILEYAYSINTHIPYIHYQVALPPVKLPGNYVVAVYRDEDKNAVVLTRRFMVYRQQVTFSRERNMVGAGSVADAYQQVNFKVNYNGLDVMNPLQNLSVNMRQNFRWDNQRMSMPPSFVRESERTLEFRYFDKSNMFRGGNEFRWFDIRSLNYPGRNVARVERAQKPYEVFAAFDKPRDTEAYAQYAEMNGQYYVNNLDVNDVAAANYAYVNFTLLTAPVEGSVHVMGAFNNWSVDNNTRMAYDAARQGYTWRTLLKQGIYDYQYGFVSNDQPADFLEGSHYQTENEYEVFVYYRPFQPNADLLVGYFRFSENAR
ncbi:MAG: DUF5103 domain-containing protein [Bacteroidia bacterium]|nr:DUF5103 domain-containing protein [Bacteroidia bacterium]